MSVLSQAVEAAFERAALSVPGTLQLGLVAYLELLERWNRTINLTAFDLAHPTGLAIERLVVEPLLAARAVPEGERSAVDIGSGGGSPAIPLALACPGLRMTLVEARQRKGAFLREAIRVLGLRASVEVDRFEDMAARLPDGTIDLISMRAVKPERGLVVQALRVLAGDGIFLWFGDIGEITNTNIAASHTEFGGRIHVLRRLG